MPILKDHMCKVKDTLLFTRAKFTQKLSLLITLCFLRHRQRVITFTALSFLPHWRCPIHYWRAGRPMTGYFWEVRLPSDRSSLTIAATEARTQPLSSHLWSSYYFSVCRDNYLILYFSLDKELKFWCCEVGISTSDLTFLSGHIKWL